MKKFKKAGLVLSLTFGSFVLTTLSGCGTVLVNTYSVTLNYDQNLGQVSVDNPKGNKGDTFTVTITPNEGVTIKSIKVNNLDHEITNSFSITAEEDNYVIDVTFESAGNIDTPNPDTPVDKSFTVTAEFDNTMGTVTLDKTSGDNYEDPNSMVKVTITPNADYYVKSILINGQSHDTSKTEFTFTPKQGENIVKVEFAKSEGPVITYDTYTLSLNYDNTKGKVIASETAGQITDGKTIEVTVTPNADYEVESVTFNSTPLELSADGKYTIIPIKGENTFTVIFKEIEVIPPVQTFTIDLIFDETGGNASLSKTSGEVGETVVLTVEPNSGFQVTATFNDGIIEFDDSYSATLTPVAGQNTVKVNFVDPTVSMLEELTSGFDISTNYDTLIGTTEVDKEYLLSFANQFKTGLNIQGSDEYLNETFSSFYDNFVSKTTVKKSSLDSILNYLDENNGYEFIKSFTQNTFQFTEENVKKLLDFFVPFVDKISEDDFVIFSYGVIIFSLTSNLYYNSLSGTFRGLDYSDLGQAVDYFTSIGDSSNAQELKPFYDSINIDYYDKYSDSLMEELEPYVVMSSKFIYNFIKQLTKLEADTTTLAKRVFNIIGLIQSFSSGKLDALYDPAKEAENYESFKFLGKILYNCLPNLESFTNLFDFLADKPDMFRTYFLWANVNSGIYINSYGDYAKRIVKAIANKGDGFYYILKLLGKSLQNSTLDEYKSFVDFMKTISSQTTQEQAYSSSIRLSKMLVRNLVEFGTAADTIKAKFADGVEALGELIGFTNGNLAIYSESEKYTSIQYVDLYVPSDENVFKNYDFSKVSEFITKASNFDPDNVTQDNITYINNFINGLTSSVGSGEQSRDHYTFTLNSNPDVGGELIYDVTYPETYVSDKIDFSKLTNFYNESPNKGKAVLEHENGVIIFNYTCGNYGTDVSTSFQFINEYGVFNNNYNTFYVKKGFEFADDDYLVIDQFNPETDRNESTNLKMNEMLIDTSKAGKHYSYYYYKNQKYFFGYYVYDESEVHETIAFGYSSKNYYAQNSYVSEDIVVVSHYLTFEADDGRKQNVSLSAKEYRLDEEVKIDTSTVGYNEIKVKPSNLDEELTITYYVGEVIDKQFNAYCYDGRGFWNYQNKESNNDELNFNLVGDYTFIGPNGEELKTTDSGILTSLTINDFEFKLSNSESGEHTDYVTYMGNKYTFKYYTYKYLYGDSVFAYHLDVPYFVGIGFHPYYGSVVSSSYSRTTYYETEFGDIISDIELGNKEDIMVYLDEVEINADDSMVNQYIDAKYVYKEVEYTIRVYVCDYTVVETYVNLVNNEFLTNNPPSDDTLFEFEKYEIINYIVPGQSWEDQLEAKTGSIEIEFSKFKDNIDLSTGGEKTFTFDPFNEGNEYQINYRVFDVDEVVLGETQTFSNYDGENGSKFARLSNAEIGNYYLIEIQNGDLNTYSQAIEQNYEIQRTEYCGESVIIAVKALDSSLTLRIDGYYGEWSYKVEELNSENSQIKASSFYVDFDGINFSFHYGYDIGIILPDGSESYFFSGEGSMMVSLEEVKEQLNDTGSTIYTLNVEIMGKQYTIEYDMSNYSYAIFNS